MLRQLLFVTVVLHGLITSAQINGYAQVTAISGVTCTIGSSQEAYASFTTGKHVVIMQMQDNVIGENTFNTSSFGALASIHSAGVYEIRQIASVQRSGGVPTSITLDETPETTFNFGSNSLVQMVTYERLGGGGNFTTTANIGAMAWNGTLGGVVAFYVEGTLRLEHNIAADQIGFRGGGRTTIGDASCNSSQYFYDSAGSDAHLYAGKGEGIYRSTGTEYAKGRGRMINGGGGGNGNNGGGAGGANYTSGGDGGPGMSCSGTPGGGVGGTSLGSHVSASRVFMGGGGGGGEGNSNASSVGARGGGIILIRATAIETVGTSAGRTISANGGSANVSGADGAGGGGAGGSIVLQVGSFNIAATSTLTIRANGGNGGSVNSATDHGAGGGGGQGTVMFLNAMPISNVTIQTVPGSGGCNNNSSPCTSQAGSGGGSSGLGIVVYSLSPLPIELISFNAFLREDVVDLHWVMASEHGSDIYSVERSADGADWDLIDVVPATQTSITSVAHTAIDRSPLQGISYYRLKNLQGNGSTFTSHAVPVQRRNSTDVSVFPNPATSEVFVHIPGENVGQLRLIDRAGRIVMGPSSVQPLMHLQLDGLSAGVYLMMIETDKAVHTERLVLQ
jgi:hypothetical protein